MQAETDVVILKNAKKWQKVGVFCSKYGYFFTNLIIALVFEKNAKNLSKIAKITIKTSTPLFFRSGKVCENVSDRYNM
jgi:hypothetical protein